MLLAANAFADEPNNVDEQRQVRSLLADRCFLCHGPDEESREADLRLDTREGAIRGGLVPGDAEASELMRRVVADDVDLRMPPPDSGKTPLSTAELAILRRWINAGAKYDVHWSFRKPQRPKLPPSTGASLEQSGLDRFVNAKLDAEGIEPASPADRYSLIRRVTLDLTGLPPSIEAIDAFVNDPSPDAYQQVVDRLLASPQYGERWALWWLDLARYADSNGYESDRTRSIWPWRDWVIDALNNDMTFDKFTIEQIAGDMLPNATDATRIATGFHRNTWINEEGGHDWEQFRHESIVDRVHTTGTVFLGLTVACAQCHDHKYDPITQREYWQLFAFLNNADEPDFWVADPEIRDRQQQIDIEIARRIAARAAHFPPLDPDVAADKKNESRRQHLDMKFRAWVDQPANRPLRWSLLDPVSAVSEGNATMTELDDHSILLTGDRPEIDSYEMVYETDANRVTGFRLEAITDSRLPNFGPGRGSFMGDGAFAISEFRVEILEASGTDKPDGTDGNVRPSSTSMEFARAIANTTSRSGVHSLAEETQIKNSIDDNKLTHWSIQGGPGKQPVAVFETTRPYDLPAGTRLRVTILQNFVHQRTLGRFRLYATGDDGPMHADQRSTSIDSLLRKEFQDHTESDRKTLKKHYLSIAPELSAYNDEIQKLQDTRPLHPTTFVFAERTNKNKRQSHVHERGEYQRPGENVSPAVPVALHPLRNDLPRNRMGLAQWLVDADNPLVARVAANQLWQSFFGRGIVSTPEDFGLQGAAPSHPKLLDWLAVEFQRNWSLKSLQRRIVTSAAYRRSSTVSPELSARDPQNILLSRGPRVRVDAETIRDIALAASGLMVHTLGGPSVFPPQPSEAGNTFGPFKWETSVGADRYRRGLYTFRKRAGPYAAFATFDAPPPNTCAMIRRRSNTPLQALAQLNDLVIVEASRALAERVLHEASGDDTERIRHAFRLVLSRPPTDAELSLLVEYHTRQWQRFDTGSLDAQKVYGAESSDNAELTALAAMTTVARLVLNLDETITKE